MDDKQYQSPPRGRHEQPDTTIEEANTSPLSSSPSQSNNPPPMSMDASSFLSPQIQPFPSNQIQLERTNSTGQQDSSQSDYALEPSITPVLNGENIVLLSMSNDNTPVADNNNPSSTSYMTGDVALAKDGQTLADSPPPDSVHSGLLTTLSPPPLSQKSGSSAPPYAERAPTTGMFSSNGSQGMFSRDMHYQTNNNHPPTVNSQNNQSHNAGGGNSSRKKRPPLPPRGAFPGISVAVDVLPLPPPKQIGSVSHRRVVSTGDVSHISNLTDGDSVADVLEESPPASTSGVQNHPSIFAATDQHGTISRQRGISLDGLGIMQPVLSEEDLSKLAMDDFDLMQPVLNDDDDEEGEVQVEDDNLNSYANKPSLPPSLRKVASASVAVMETKVGMGQASAALLKMKAASEQKISQKGEGDSNNKVGSWDKLRNQALSHEGVFMTKKGSGSKFEAEAERAILEALNQFNISPAPSREEPENHEEQSPHTPNDEEIPSHLSAMRVSHVSSVTSSGSGNNNPLNIHNLNQKGTVQLFEDQGWHDGYDELGRNKGSLREEQDAKYAEEATVDSQIKLSVLEEEEQIIAEEPPHPPIQSNHKAFGSIVAGLKNVMRHKKDDATEETASRKKKDDDYRGEEDDDDDEDEKGGTEIEPWHKREKTMVSDMTQEMQKFQTAGDMHNHNKTHMSKDSHGVDNLLNGVDLLFKVDEKKAGKANKPEQIEEGNEDDEYNENGTGEGDEENPNPPKRKKAHFIGARSRQARHKSERFHQWRVWWLDLIKPKIPDFLDSLQHNALFIYIPLISLAFILYYPCGNPMAAEYEDGDISVDSASWSWWVLFIVRQAFVLGCVKAWEVITIDIIALRTSIFIDTFGSFATLMLVQARGWPYILVCWGIMDFIFLFGRHPLAAHWLFWQNLEIFTAANPGGSFIYSVTYMRVLITMITCGLLTALKRLWLASRLGERSYDHFGQELEIILSKMLLVSSVAHLGHHIESQTMTNKIDDGYIFASITNSAKAFPGLSSDTEDDTPVLRERKVLQSGASSDNNSVGFGRTLLEAGIVPSSKNLKKEKFVESKKMEIMNLLEEWEEPQFHYASKTKIKDILQFRQAISLLNNDMCFTPAFGSTLTRAICVNSSEKLFNRLVNNDSTADLLPFETIAEIAYDSKGKLIRPKVKAMIKLFRPDRNGYITKIEFLNTIDGVYKSIRLFRASLESSSQVDDNLESIINVVFYAILVIISLLTMGFQVWESLLSISTFFFGFSFTFGPASSNYFEGLLLILIRRPYDVGDKIALSDPASDTSSSGSSTWFVEKVTLFTTTVRFATTNEVATYSNGSLARLRIINAKRSPKAVLYVYVKFGSDAPYHKLKLFRSAIENFVKARPREWAQLNGIRTTRVEMELNYVEYVIVATHREMWQNIGPILSSKADLDSFSLEVSKKLDLRYEQPPKPIHLSFDKISSSGDDNTQRSKSTGQVDMKSVFDLFNE